jgi:periplasmic divalent cation tolerance protein
MPEHIQVFVTIDDESKAVEIAEDIINKKLAACVQITGPATSVYRWEGKVNKDKEWLLIFKTSGKLYDELEEEIKRQHTYEIPEILALPVIKGNMDYLNWLNMELK